MLGEYLLLFFEAAGGGDACPGALGQEAGILASWQGSSSNQAPKTGLQLLGVEALRSAGVP